MRRVTVLAGEVFVANTQRPTPETGEVQIRTVLAGVCGSDIQAAAGHHQFLALPYNPGHEVVGMISALGDGVTTLSVGDRVVVNPVLPCRRCKQCRAGRSNLCETLKVFGCVADQGGMADFFTIPADRVVRLPEDLSDLQSILIEPLATPVHAVELAGGVADKSVVILGAGTIGLLVLAAARHAGARRVVMTDLVESKRQRASRLGADAVIDARASDAAVRVRDALGESADVVFDCVATQSTIDQAIVMATKGGMIMILGVPARPIGLPLPEIQDWQIGVQGSAMYLSQDFATAIDILRSGLVHPEEMVTATFGLNEAAQAFAAAASDEHVKVILRAWSPSTPDGLNRAERVVT